jgi:hypothetical protein
MTKLHQMIEREDFPMFPIENIFICLKEIFSEAWCDIILPSSKSCSYRKKLDGDRKTKDSLYFDEKRAIRRQLHGIQK